jgi:hypothetical protein
LCLPEAKERHPERQERHPEAKDRHPERQERHPEAKDRHPERQERHPEAKDDHLVRRNYLLSMLFKLRKERQPSLDGAFWTDFKTCGFFLIRPNRFSETC